MNIDPVITQLRTYCTPLAGRVAGAAEFKGLDENVNVAVPSAFVVMMDDEPDAQMSSNDVYQKITEKFGVIVCLSNVADERGQAAAENYHSIRAALWASLLGWQPTSQHRGCGYVGASLLALDRSRAWYQFDFGADFYIGPEDGWQSNPVNSTTGAAAPNLTDVHIKVDMIDPAALPYPGPDGRIEIEADITLT